ncbi:ABC transporter permease [Rarobacter faecitabidus]|uniref:Transport permease protein n=1 Tax=Rarobacter faecitabidus TaxID=13243 RepID=A0A542Z8L7_RARFA|nr:ABC transporter permease [Rarobacter faecitabidus]TQL56651.1 lipooligosaccharide transport system permease protein [Rarobacter faecitabidus]
MSAPTPATENSSAKLPAQTLDEFRARAMAGGRRPRRRGTWYVAFGRFYNMRAYLQTIVWTAIGTPVLYLFAMGIGLGSLVSANLGHGAVGGVDYLTFVAPALLVTAAASVGSEEMTYPVMLGFKWNPTFFATNAAPISPAQIINGLVVSVIARLTFVTSIYLAVLLAFRATGSAWSWLLVPIGVLTALGFNALIMAYVATIQQDTGQIAMLMRFVVMPLTLFSGTFFPLDTMPGYLQPVGWLSPLWHGAQLARTASYGMAEPWWLIAIRVCYLGALAAAGWLLSQRIAARRLGR